MPGIAASWVSSFDFGSTLTAERPLDRMRNLGQRRLHSQSSFELGKQLVTHQQARIVVGHKVWNWNNQVLNRIGFRNQLRLSKSAALDYEHLVLNNVLEIQLLKHEIKCTLQFDGTACRLIDTGWSIVQPSSWIDLSSISIGIPNISLRFFMTSTSGRCQTNPRMIPRGVINATFRLAASWIRSENAIVDVTFAPNPWRYQITWTFDHRSGWKNLQCS